MTWNKIYTLNFNTDTFIAIEANSYSDSSRGLCMGLFRAL